MTAELSPFHTPYDVLWLRSCHRSITPYHLAKQVMRGQWHCSTESTPTGSPNSKQSNQTREPACTGTVVQPPTPFIPFYNSLEEAPLSLKCVAFLFPSSQGGRGRLPNFYLQAKESQPSGEGKPSFPPLYLAKESEAQSSLRPSLALFTLLNCLFLIWARSRFPPHGV